MGIRSNTNMEQDSRIVNWIKFQERIHKFKRGIQFPKAKRDLQVYLEMKKKAKDPKYKYRTPGPADYEVEKGVNMVNRQNPAYKI